MLPKEKIYEVIHNPWFLQVIDRHDLEKIAKEYPYFNLIHALIAKKAQLQNHASLDSYLSKAAVYAGNRECLYNLLNNISNTSQTGTPKENMILIDYAAKAPVAERTLNAPTSSEMFGDNTPPPIAKLLPGDPIVKPSGVIWEDEKPVEKADKLASEMAQLSVIQHETTYMAFDETSELPDLPITGNEEVEMSLLPMTELPDTIEPPSIPFIAQAQAFVAENKAQLPAATLTKEGTLITDDEGKTTWFDMTDTHSFMEWLSFFKADKPVIKKEANKQDDTVLEMPLFEIKHDLFQIKSETPMPTLEELKPAGINVLTNSTTAPKPAEAALVQANRSVVESEEDMVSETLAQVLEAQGLYEKAIVMYARLSLLNPKKSLYFADLIKKIKKKNNL